MTSSISISSATLRLWRALLAFPRLVASTSARLLSRIRPADQSSARRRPGGGFLCSRPAPILRRDELTPCCGALCLPGCAVCAFAHTCARCRPGTEGTPACNYGRHCGSVKAAGRDVGEVPIAEGLAKPFKCGSTHCLPTPKPWCLLTPKT
jgi:hypothetical protein